MCQHPPLSFLQAGCPYCRPTNSVKALKATATGHSAEGMLSQSATCPDSSFSEAAECSSVVVGYSTVLGHGNTLLLHLTFICEIVAAGFAHEDMHCLCHCVLL